MAQNNSYTFDVEGLMKDAGVIAASAAATVDSVAKVFPAGQAFMEGLLVIDVTAIEIASNDEIYHIIVQGAAASAFTTPYTLAALPLGATEVTPGSAPDATVGRYFLRWQNEQNGTIYPYIRVYTNVAGTIATGINYTAWIAKTGSAS